MNSAEGISLSQVIDTTSILPKITNVSNQRSELDSSKVTLKIDFINHFNYKINFNVGLYNKQKQIFKSSKSTEEDEGEILFTTKTSFDADKDFSKYYYDVKINFVNDNDKTQQIYETVINFNSENLISYGHYKKSLAVPIIIFLVILLIFLIFLIILAIYLITKKRNKTQMIKVYEEVTGIQLVK